MTEPGLAATARAIIDASRYMTLATADAGGRPWASPVFYAAAGYAELYWISAPGSAHSQNIEIYGAHPAVFHKKIYAPAELPAHALSITGYLYE